MGEGFSSASISSASSRAQTNAVLSVDQAEVEGEEVNMAGSAILVNRAGVFGVAGSLLSQSFRVQRSGLLPLALEQGGRRQPFVGPRLEPRLRTYLSERDVAAILGAGP